MNINITVPNVVIHVDDHHAATRHAELVARLDRLLAQGVKLMSAYDDLVARFDRADAATTKIAEDIRVIKEQITTGLTPAEVQALQDKAEALAGRLEALDAENPEGTTEPPPA